ncbi:hypothetical protein K9K77_02690, partial [Candidatus Babeliales bacterium]|nr:hypothetical protein [Candidatus Babeliales bacterium]
MDRYKKIVLCLFLSVFSAQAGWFNDTKNWIKKTEQKIENIVTDSVKKVRSVFISDTKKPTPSLVLPIKKVPPV